MLHGRTRMFRIRGEKGFTDTYLHILIQNYVNYLPIKNIFFTENKAITTSSQGFVKDKVRKYM